MIVVFAFAGLGASLYPQMIPHPVSPVTVAEAAASPMTLRFMLIVMAVVIPLIVFYTSYAYRVFRGKVGAEGYE